LKLLLLTTLTRTKSDRFDYYRGRSFSHRDTRYLLYRSSGTKRIHR